ncbi:MAG TPA: FecR domain-containing protein [Chryseosolibacter sp.]|nr:FecR domain-containing protein [Chryseosolibacter sp.]
MRPHQLQHLLDKYSRGECTPEEEQLISDWYDRIGADEQFDDKAEESHFTANEIWQHINPSPEDRPLWPRILLRSAAVVIPLIALASLFLTRDTISQLITTSPSEAPHASALRTFYNNESTVPRRIVLPDGSKVELQPASEIRLADHYGNTTRELHLKGEAFFDVSRDPERPFLVYANEVVTRVLGTSFSVKAYEGDKEITVAVKTGKVSVYTNKHEASGQLAQAKEVVLTPNQQIVYHRFREVVSKQLVEEPQIILPDSKLFRMHFDNAPVTEIFEELSKNYGVEIRYDAKVLRHCRLTTSMFDEGLYERIEVICRAIGASYAVSSDAAITIKSKGC